MTTLALQLDEITASIPGESANGSTAGWRTSPALGSPSALPLVTLHPTSR